MRAKAAFDWRDRHASAADAVSVVRPGNSVFVGSACATPRTLVDALEKLMRPGVVLVHFLTDRVPEQTNYRHRVFYVGSDVRDLADSSRVEYLPLSLDDVPRLFANGQLPLDVAMVQVAPPDADGTCSLGISVDVTKAAALAARTVIAEVNPAMPRTAGDSRIPADRIASFVHVDTPVVEYLHDRAGEVAEQIARYVARLIDDRSTLQIGLGRVPNEMLAHLTNRRDLAIHSDVITEPIVDLVDADVVTGPVATSWAMGTRHLYDLVDDDPRFAFHPIEYICDSKVIQTRERMVSVTQASASTSPARCAPSFWTGSSTAGSPPARPSIAARLRPPAAWQSSASLHGLRRAAPRSPSSSVPARRSRSRGPTCTGSLPSTAPRTCSAARWPSARSP